MSLEQRLKALEEKLTAQQGTCATCGGLHTRHWIEYVQAVTNDVSVCLCRGCCGWLAEMTAEALADGANWRATNRRRGL